MSVTIRQEINILSGIMQVSSASTTGADGVVQLDTSQYVSPTYYFEIEYAFTATGLGSPTVSLRRNGTTTDDVTVTTSSADLLIHRLRSASFTPPAGQTEYKVFGTTPSSSNYKIRAARIIVIDSPTTLTSTETQIEIGMNKTGLTSSVSSPKVVPDTTLTKYWKYTAANWNGTKTFLAEVTYLMASSKSGGTFVLQEDDGSFGTWTDKVTIVSAGVATVATRTRSASFTPTDGRNYRIAYFVASSKSAATIFNAKIIVDQSASPTLLEPQYLLLNTANSGTGLQSYLTLIDTSSAEWSSVTNTYKHAMDSNNAANATKLEDTTTTTILSTSAVTGANQQISGDMSSQLVSGDTLDTDIITATGVIAASRILVGVTVSSAVNASITQVAASVTATGGTQSVSATIIASAAVTQVAATVTAGGGTQLVKTLAPISQVAGVVTATGGVQTVATSNFVNLTQIAGVVTANGGTQVIATVNNVALTQVAANVTATGGTQSIATINNIALTQVAGTVIASGGTQVVATSNLVAITQVAGSITASGGAELVQVNSSNIQIAASVTASAGIQGIAAVNIVAITQTAATVTAGGGTQTFATVNNASISQIAGSVIASGGVQAIATVNNVSLAQFAGNVTATGGTQSLGGVLSASIIQVAVSVNGTGGTQTIASNQFVAISQVNAVVTASGGIQVVQTNASITQLAANVIASGGTQVVACAQLVAIAQVAASITGSGGVQSLGSIINSSIPQVSASVIASGGLQNIQANAPTGNSAKTLSLLGVG